MMAMKKSKRERLEAAGWRVGTAAEFLGLSKEEAAFVEMKLALADGVRRRRQARRLTQNQLADACREDGNRRSLGLDRSSGEDAPCNGSEPGRGCARDPHASSSRRLTDGRSAAAARIGYHAGCGRKRTNWLGLAAVSCSGLLDRALRPFGYVGPGAEATGMDWQERITVNPAVRSGKPCIKGTRITVYDVLEYLAGGMSEDQILADFPDLTRDDIRASLAFAAARERRLSSPAA
jgi:uncharacterized protein (DUF433 family)